MRVWPFSNASGDRVVGLEIFDQASIGTEDTLGHASFLSGLVDDASLDLVEEFLDICSTATKRSTLEIIQFQLQGELYQASVAP